MLIKSSNDDYLLTYGDTIVLFWVDDYIFYSESAKTIDEVILSLKDEFLLEREEDMADFLGIKITRDE